MITVAYSSFGRLSVQWQNMGITRVLSFAVNKANLKRAFGSFP